MYLLYLGESPAMTCNVEKIPEFQTYYKSIYKNKKVKEMIINETFRSNY